MKGFYILIGLISGLLFGIATPLSKILLSDLNAFELAGLLYIGASIAVFPSVIKNFKQIKLFFANKHRLKQMLGIIVFGGLLGPVFLLFGLKTADGASVSIWLNMELVATAVLGVLLYKDHLGKLIWVGLSLTILAGVIIAIGEGYSGIFSGLLVFVACFFWGLDNNLTARINGVSPQMITFMKGIFAGSVNLIIGLSISSKSFLFAALPYAIILGAFSYGISIVLYITSAQNLGATRSQVLFSTAPFWGILFSYLLLKTKISLSYIIAMLLLVGGIILTNVLVHKPEHEEITDTLT